MSEPLSDSSNRPPSDHGPIDLRLLLICHAEEMQNRYASLAGADSGLTAIGWRQTDRLAQWLAAHYQIDALVAAPQLRNRLTAQRIGQAIGLPVAVRQSLTFEREIVSVVEGAPAALVADDAKGGADLSDAGLYDADAFGAEVCTVCAQIVEQYRGSTVAIFLSGNLIAAVMACLFEADNLHAVLAHTSVTELQLRGNRWYLACMNRHEHLPRSVNPEVAQMPQEGDRLNSAENLSLLSEVYGQNVASGIEMEDEARRQRFDSLIDFADLSPDMQVLDVGTGTGMLALTLAESSNVSVIGVDISPAMLERAELFRLNTAPEIAKRVDFRLAAAQRLPFGRERFDAVICRMMLHLNRQPERIFQEAWRVLKPNGILIVADLLSADDAVRRATQNTIEERRNAAHVAAHSAAQYRNFVSGVGFTIESEKKIVFGRKLENWLNELATDPSDGAVVREMVEASLETDAAGINARRRGDDIVFDQRLVYIRARKPAAEE